MKKIIFMMLIFFNVFSAGVYAFGVDDVLDSNSRDNIENAFEKTDVNFDALKFIDKLNNGNFNMDYQGLGDYIKTNVLNEFKENFGFAVYIFVLIMLSSLVENIYESFNNDRLVRFVISSVVVSGLITVTYNIVEYSVQVIDRLILFINSLIPTLMTLLATSGKMGTSGVLNPIMLGVSSVISSIIKSFVVPLCIIGLVLKLTGSVTEKSHLTNFGNQIHKLLKWSLGLMVTVYVGIIGIIGVAAPKVDDITLKTAKYAVGNFIPHVGGMVADSVDLILECSSVVKNSVGIAGLIGVLSIVAIPCIKIAVKLILINILGVIVSPVSNKPIIDSVNNVSSSLGILFGMNIVVSIMYILSITVIIFIGGA